MLSKYGRAKQENVLAGTIRTNVQTPPTGAPDEEFCLAGRALASNSMELDRPAAFQQTHPCQVTNEEAQPCGN